MSDVLTKVTYIYNYLLPAIRVLFNWLFSDDHCRLGRVHRNYLKENPLILVVWDFHTLDDLTVTHPTLSERWR